MSTKRMRKRGRVAIGLSVVILVTLSSRAMAVPDPPIAEDPPIAKIRYISFTPGNAGTMVALRVTLSHLECGAGDGLVRWVGPPAEYNDQPSSLGTFMGSYLQCTPHYQDWGDVGLLHVGSSFLADEIVPGSIYAVQAIEQGDNESAEANYSDALVTFTVRGNEAVGQWDGTKWGPSDGLVTVHEIVAGYATFAGPGGLALGKQRSRAQSDPFEAALGFNAFSHFYGTFSGEYFCPFPQADACPGSALFACGNGTLEPGELCDDFNTISGDGCSALCLIEPDCGNGRMEYGEYCDDGNTTPGDGCDANCDRESVCGNGLIELDEECDDGGAVGGDGCDANCLAEVRSASLTMTPRKASRGYSISGSTMSLARAGQLVWFDAGLRDWDPDLDGSVELFALQLELDTVGLRGGLPTGLLVPQVQCPNHDFCESTLGSNSNCYTNYCQPVFLSDVSPVTLSLAAEDSTTVGMRFAAWDTSVSADTGITRGVATFVLDVPEDASGTYTVDLRTGYAHTVLLDTDRLPIPVATIQSATIQVPAPNRFLPFRLNSDNVAAGEPLGVQVKILDMPQFPAAEGSVRWATAPAGHADAMPGSFFFASGLQCAPVAHDWNLIEVISLFGAEVVPGSTYEIRTATATCIALGEESCMSPPVIVSTSPKWCDVAFPMGGVGQPNFGDISAVVGAFQGQLTSPGKVRAMVQPRVPNPASAVSFSDISAAVTAFQTGGVYPYAGPDACP